jgi:predicted RNA methylase
MTTLVSHEIDSMSLPAVYVKSLQQQLNLMQPAWVSAAMSDSFAIADCLLQLLHPHDRVLDVGCGTGVISIALGLHGFDVAGCDLSDAAVKTARDNAARHGLAASFLHSDLLDSVEGKFDAVVFNPPYGFATDNAFWNLAKNLARRLGPLRRASGTSMPHAVRRFQRKLLGRFFRNGPQHLTDRGSLWVHTYQTQRNDFLAVAPENVKVCWLNHPGFALNETGLLRITPV